MLEDLSDTLPHCVTYGGMDHAVRLLVAQCGVSSAHGEPDIVTSAMRINNRAF